MRDDKNHREGDTCSAVLCPVDMDMRWANGDMFTFRSGRVSHVTANDPDPMGGGREEKLMYVDSTAEGVRDIARGSNRRCTLC